MKARTRGAGRPARAGRSGAAARRAKDDLERMDDLRDDEAGAIRIGPTDGGMVRIFVITRNGETQLDYAPEEAEEIAAELIASAEEARGGGGGRRRKPRG